MKIIKNKLEESSQEKLQADILMLLKKHGMGAGDFSTKSATIGALWKYFDETEKDSEKDIFKRNIDKLNSQCYDMRR